jgi:predicted flap endonuclease-1-like 5' DNA nuclease
MAKIDQIEGIGEAYGRRLAAAGIETTEDLLAHGGTVQGRRAIAEKTGIADGLILRWVKHLDLIRVKGVAWQYSELLEAAGVDTVAELAQRKPENLAAKLAETNADRKLVRQLPSRKSVADWVSQAQALPCTVRH